jgi:hypothetical protein
MRLRLLGLGLLALAVLLHAGYAVPSRAAAAAAADEQRRLRSERREVQQRLGRAQREQAARAAAARAIGAAPVPDGREAPLLRRALLASLQELPLGAVRLSVRPGRSPVGASASLAAEGALDDVLLLSTELVRPGRGLALSRARFSAVPDGVGLELDLFSLRQAP